MVAHLQPFSLFIPKSTSKTIIRLFPQQHGTAQAEQMDSCATHYLQLMYTHFLLQQFLCLHFMYYICVLNQNRALWKLRLYLER